MGKKGKFQGKSVPLTCDVVKNEGGGQGGLQKGQGSGGGGGGMTKGSSLENLSVDGMLEVESTLEKLMNKVNDEGSLKAFATLWNKEIEGRRTLLEANGNPMYEEFEKLIAARKLDSNLKKCTAFVRRLKQYTEPQKNSIENEIKLLNLSKYLSEIATNLSEARFKIDNVGDAVYLCSMIHQRYQEFTGMLVENYKKTLPLKKADMSTSVVSKLSVDIRMIGELVVCGVIPRKEGCTMLHSVLKNLIDSDKEGMQCFLPVMSFVMGLGDPFLGVLPRKITTLAQEHNVTLDRHDFMPENVQTVFKSTILEYFNVVSRTLTKMHQEKQKSELYNRKLLRTKGELPTDRKEAHAGILAKFEKYNASAIKFADALDKDLPEFEDLPADPEEEEEKALLRTESGELMDAVPGIFLFEDEETRSFYQDFKDLKVYLPPVAYRESIQQSAEETQKIEEREKALKDFDDEAETAELESEDVGLDEEIGEEAESELPPSLRNDSEEKETEIPIKASFQDFLDRLPNCGSRAFIDKAALEFAESFNTKPNRKKLVQTLFKVPRQRIDLLPFYGRMMAILNPVMPDVGLELCRLLKNDFFFLVKRKHQIFIETKLKIVRFIGELVNFRIFPKSDALHCLKILLMNFVHHQIEMACVFVETCGRVLYRTPDSHRRMKIYLEEMMRKKGVKRLEPRYTCMIDHAYSIVLPPENAARPEKKLTPIELYLRPILLEDLNKATYENACNVLKSLPWDDEWTSEVAVRYLTSPWELTVQQLQYQVQLLVDLKPVEPHVVTRIVDAVMEEVRRGLENPWVLFNHRRFSTLSYLCEMYYFRLIRTDALFDILYLLITYGVSWDALKYTAMDTPDNLNRIRLCCYVLKELGEYLVQGSNKKRLRLFLLHLQKYFWIKRSHPFWTQRKFPYGVYEALEETARKLYPKMKFAQSYEEAVEVLAEKEEDVDENMKTAHGKLPKLMPVPQTTGLLPFVDPMQRYYEMQEQLAAAAGHGKGSGSRYKNGTVGLAEQGIPEEDDELDPYERASQSSRPQKPKMTPEDEEFNALFEKMCSEVSYTGRQTKTELVIPLNIHSAVQNTTVENNVGESDTVPFILMTKKGNKNQFKTLSLPVDSDYVQKMRTREEMERAEKESVKIRTLAISELQEKEERQREVEAIKNAFTISSSSRQKDSYADPCAAGDNGFYVPPPNNQQYLSFGTGYTYEDNLERNTNHDIKPHRGTCFVNKRSGLLKDKAVREQYGVMVGAGEGQGRKKRHMINKGRSLEEAEELVNHLGKGKTRVDKKYRRNRK